MHKFSQKVYRVGVNYAVDPPPAISDAFGKRGSIPVKGAINGAPFRATLVPIGGGRHRLFLNEKLRTEAGIDAGALIRVTIEIDTEPREQAMPPALEAALDRRPLAKATFNSFPPSHKKEILAYLNSLKSQEALDSNIDKLLAKLEKG